MSMLRNVEGCERDGWMDGWTDGRDGMCVQYSTAHDRIMAVVICSVCLSLATYSFTYQQTGRRHGRNSR